MKSIQYTGTQTTERVASSLLPGLTGLRGVGALWVVTYHAQYGMSLPIASAGYLGVDLFFILSGFVLSHAHQNIQWTLRNYWSFLRNRFARIFPMHWAALTFLFLILVVFPEIKHDMPTKFAQPDLIKSALLIQNWGFGGAGSWNGPAWSLSMEWLVSIGFPVFLLISQRVVRPISAVLLCAACLASFAAFLALTHNPNPGVISSRAGLVRTVCEFMAGCLLYRHYAAGVKIDFVAGLGGVILVLVGVLVPSLAILAVFGFSVLILLAAQPSTPVARMLSTWVMLTLGNISFSVYLMHWMLLLVSERLQASWQLGPAAALVCFCCYVAIVIALSTATYRFIEVPACRWLRSGEPQRTPPLLQTLATNRARHKISALIINCILLISLTNQ